MPELPEVETIKNTLNQLVLNKTISSVDVFREQTIISDISDFCSELNGKTIIGFERIGKFIIFHLSGDLVMISHLRMEGKYFLKDENEKITKHDLVVFHFTDKTKLIYNDTRRFGIIKLSNKNNYKNEEPLSKVGPDPFMMENEIPLFEAYKKKTIAIKTALLDQSIMSGLGNIYVDEVLFESKIHPETPANMVTKKEIQLIWENSKKILTKAIDQGGTTIKSYHPKEGVSGNFQVDLKVYGKKDDICPRCGRRFKKIFVNGRGTTFCPNCQENPAKPLVFGLTGPIGSGKSTVSKEFIKHGFEPINCDEIVHELYLEKDIQDDIKKFIPHLKITNNQIDRFYLKDYLIKNPNKKKELEKYIFAKVTIIVKKIINKSKKPIILEAPLLFEAKLDLLCNEIIYIEINEKQQIKNLLSRNSDVESSIKLNETYNKKIAKEKATIIIYNNKDVAYLNKQIDSIFCK